MKKSGLRHLTPKEFDAALLEKLTREGRVYIDFPKEVDKDAYMREVLDYVQPIREFATEMWQEDIDRLWLDIVSNDVFSDFLSMSLWPAGRTHQPLCCDKPRVQDEE